MKAIVKSPICPLMSQPRQDCERADEALFGMVVEVLERTTPGYCRVRTHYRYEGYASVDDLVFLDEKAEWWAGLPKRVVLHKNVCDVMAEPKVQSWQRLTLPRGAVVSPVGEPEEGWQRVTLPDGGEGYLRAGYLGDYWDAPPDLPEDELRRRIVETAMLYAGTHYRWGGKSPLGIDCSGLTSMAYLLIGILIYRDARSVAGFPIRELP
ncbi:MAG: C40 family peptidase, partial [Oscillospiraceae bacterium]|nr:C40 family peptidase [Oscillospiraceae bacterium]